MTVIAIFPTSSMRRSLSVIPMLSADRSDHHHGARFDNGTRTAAMLCAMAGSQVEVKGSNWTVF